MSNGDLGRPREITRTVLWVVLALLGFATTIIGAGVWAGSIYSELRLITYRLEQIEVAFKATSSHSQEVANAYADLQWRLKMLEQRMAAEEATHGRP